jgi:hypothetical protein
MLTSSKWRWMVLILATAVKAGNVQAQQPIRNWSIVSPPSADATLSAESTAPIWKLRICIGDDALVDWTSPLAFHREL